MPVLEVVPMKTDNDGYEKGIEDGLDHPIGREIRDGDSGHGQQYIGRALLNKRRDFDYLTIWEIDFTSSINRTNHSHLRNIEKEKDIDSQITELLCKQF